MEGEAMGSLERWVRTRGVQFAGTEYSKRAFNFQVGVGVVCLAGGVVFAAAVPILGWDWHDMLAGLGPGIAGLTNLIVPLALRKRFEAMRPVAVPLSAEARGVLRALNRKFLGRAHPWAWDYSYWQEEKQAWSGANNWGWGPNPIRAAQPELTSGVLEVLEMAAFQCNRISAILATASGSQSAIARLSGKVSRASDEGMAEILNLCGMMGAYPEGVEAVQLRLDGAIEDIRELGDRVQALAATEPTFTERLATRTGLHDVLDELRLEQAARSELGSHSDEHSQNA
jgi:hypothetical protein